MRPVTSRPRAVKMPKPCEYCLGDVYMVDGATSCAACGKKPTPKAVSADECPACGAEVAEGVPHVEPTR